MKIKNIRYIIATSMLVGAVYGLLTRQQKPKGAHVVQDIDLEKYSGKWYEIARLDHSFERGLSRVTADYSRREDGGLRVPTRINAQRGDDRVRLIVDGWGGE